ncbi:MAG TPA: hypothetical protein VN732_08205 [Solirubrobacterales bacterium]|nr:hypothetical protein [Solirubrobacterales bacterium]
MLIFDDGSPSLGRVVLGSIAAFGLIVGWAFLLRRWKLWISPIKRRLAKLGKSSQDDRGEEIEDEDGFLFWLRFTVWSKIRDPMSFLAPPMKEVGQNATAWPLCAVVFSAVLALWLPSLHLHHDFFVAISQVIPVLMVAAFVEAAALFRVYMPVIVRVFENRSGAPTPPQFFAFRQHMKNLLWLAVVGEIAALVALGAESDSTFLGILSGVSTLVVALALTSTFFERLQLDQFLKTRSPGGGEGLSSPVQDEVEEQSS